MYDKLEEKKERKWKEVNHKQYALRADMELGSP
jgi:hypothetical protein